MYFFCFVLESGYLSSKVIRTRISHLEDGFGSVGPIRRLHRTYGARTPKGTSLSRHASSSPFWAERTDASKSFSPMFKEKHESGASTSSSMKVLPGTSKNSSAKFLPVDVETPSSNIGVSTVHPHSCDVARKILEHLDRSMLTPKKKSEELKVATSWRKPLSSQLPTSTLNAQFNNSLVEGPDSHCNMFGSRFSGQGKEVGETSLPKVQPEQSKIDESTDAVITSTTTSNTVSTKGDFGCSVVLNSRPFFDFNKSHDPIFNAHKVLDAGSVKVCAAVESLCTLIEILIIQEFHLKTMERADQHDDDTSTVVSATESSHQNQWDPHKLTEPKMPRLETLLRARPPKVKSTEELEKEELEKIPKFKARPLNKKIFESKGDLGIYCNAKRQVTVPHEFSFATDERNILTVDSSRLLRALRCSLSIHKSYYFCIAGMHAWFAAALDTRYAVVAPIIGVQGFRWAVDNDKWQARVDSIKPVFEEARVPLGKDEIDKEVVEKVWDRIAPGLASQFDAPFTIPIIAPRPLLILNGADDPRCPIQGLDIPISRAQEAYKAANCPENFKGSEGLSQYRQQYVGQENAHTLLVSGVQSVSLYQPSPVPYTSNYQVLHSHHFQYIEQATTERNGACS